MAEEERTRKNNELKIKRRDYTGYDDDEFGDGKAGMKRSILAKYDEDIEGPRESVRVSHPQRSIRINPLPIFQDFRLGNSLTSTTISGVQAKQEIASVNKSLLSIDYASQFLSLLSACLLLINLAFRKFGNA